MALYLLSYDISEKNNDYQSLWDFLDAENATKILFSEWAVPYSGTAKDLAAEGMKHIEKGDKLFVCELFAGTPSTASWNKLIITSDAMRKLYTDYARVLS